MSDWIKKRSGKLTLWWEAVEPEGIPYAISFDGKRLPHVDDVWILFSIAASEVHPSDLPVSAAFEIAEDWLGEGYLYFSDERRFLITRMSPKTLRLEFSVYRDEEDYEPEPGMFEREVQTFHEVARDLRETGDVTVLEYDAESWQETLRRMDPHRHAALKESNQQIRQSDAQEDRDGTDGPFDLPLYQPHEEPPHCQWAPPNNPRWYSCSFGKTFDLEDNNWGSLEPYVQEGIRLREEIFTEVDRRLGRLEVPDTIDNEEKFTRLVVKPLLRDLGFHHVETLHGPDENGKDVVFARLTEFGDFEWWAAQVKFGDVSGSAKRGEVQTILNQIRSAFGTQFVSSYTKRRETVSKVAVVISGAFTSNARKELTQRLSEPSHWSNVVFIDGERVEELKQAVERDTG